MSMGDQASRQHGGKNLFRTAAAVSTAAILLGSSFYAAQAGVFGGYGPGGAGGDTDGDSTVKTAAIVAGSAVGLFLLAGAIDRDDDKDEAKSDDKAKSAKSGKVEQVRVLPSQTVLGAGDTATVQVQARFSGSQNWQTVTESASINLVSGGLTQIDGSKNAFAVPYGSKALSGPATVEASFGGKSVTAEFRVN
jgi:hypothetical protein